MRYSFVEDVKSVVGDSFVGLEQERRVRWDWGWLGWRSCRTGRTGRTCGTGLTGDGVVWGVFLGRSDGGFFWIRLGGVRRVEEGMHSGECAYGREALGKCLSLGKGVGVFWGFDFLGGLGLVGG
jgi:hypothetical protein